MIREISELIVIAIIPLIVSISLYLVFKKYNPKYWTKQIIAGIVFGILAILGTEFGIEVSGATMNARDASPLCAGLIFGAPAGIISGLIGGIERWFSVYWGVGAYTRVACTISTIITGFLGAILKKEMFENKIPPYQHAFVIGIVAETIHMMMVFITNTEDVTKAFSVVKTCTIPMVMVNSLAVMLAVFVINRIEKKQNQEQEPKKKSISEMFMAGMLALVSVALIVTTIFIDNLQGQASKGQANDVLRVALEDIENKVSHSSSDHLIEIARSIASIAESDADLPIDVLVQNYGVAEINIIDKNGVIIESNNPSYIGFSMFSNDQSRNFMALLESSDEVVQPYGPTSFDKNVYRKYAGRKISDGKIVQVAYDAKELQEDIIHEINDIAEYRHVNKNGSLMVVDSNGTIISDNYGNVGKTLSDLGVSFNTEGYNEKTLYKVDINDESYYFMYTTTEGYTIFSTMTEEEISESKELSTYLNIYLETIVFGGLFVLTYFMIKGLIVDKVQSIDKSLEKIASGDLDTVVNIRNTAEFDSLSTAINTTVDAMKDLIDQANKRIDDELQYAKDIQASSLPSVFPPYPDRKEFDIYALMDPAKQVGGDFYDFYLLDRHTLIFLVADVAGKGIPAALFMMKAKSILKTYATAGIAIEDCFTNGNFNLCDGNDAGMFVTAWMGCLNTETGELIYSNAGHNKPLIRRKNGDFEFLQGPAGFVLGGMEGIAYKRQTITLEPGDEIFIYTDGVVEATNVNQELYGNDRLQNALNKHKEDNAMNLIDHIKEDVDAFYEGAPQFDDITMLSVKFKKYFERKD